MVRKEADTCRSGIEELASLNSLWVLCIVNLENVRGGIQDARRTKLNMRDLWLMWRSHEKHSDEERSDDEMLSEGLQPHPNSIIVGVKASKVDGGFIV